VRGRTLGALTFALGVLYLDPGDAWTQTDGSQAAQAGVSVEEPVARVAYRLGPSAVQINVASVQQTPYGTLEGEGMARNAPPTWGEPGSSLPKQQPPPLWLIIGGAVFAAVMIFGVALVRLIGLDAGVEHTIAAGRVVHSAS
jgi:hypothetical protein